MSYFRPSFSTAFFSEAVALSHNAGSPTLFSGRVEMYAWNSSKPKHLSMWMEKRRTSAISSSICSGVQNRWASSCVKPRTLIRPCSAPAFS